MICHLTGGHHTYKLDFTAHTALPGTIIQVQPQQVLRFPAHDDWDGLLLRFAPEFLPPIQRDRSEGALLTAFRTLPTQWQPEPSFGASIHAQLQQMQDTLALEMPAATQRSLLRFQLYGLLTLLTVSTPAPHASTSRHPQAQRFRRFEALLEQDFPAQHQLGHYAALLHCTERSLTRACLEMSGHSAKTLIRSRLLLEARRLLAYTDLSIQEVASRLGFHEPTHFVRFFRTQTGLTPAAYRENGWQHTA